MDTCSIVGEPGIEDGAVVVRVLLQDPSAENSGRVIICRMTGFDAMSVETFPAGQTPHEEGEHRAEAAEFARRYAETHLALFEGLFEELARRKNAG
jgi:hypothetical protein